MALSRALLPIKLGIGFLVMASVGVSHADCLTRCLPMCDYRQPYCREMQDQCSAQCAGKGSHDFGAIAYSRSTGSTGWSNKRDTRDEAESSALEYCGEGDCEIEVWFDGTCAAIATGNDGQPRWALGATAQEAQTNSVAKCQDEGGGTCEVRETACSRGRAD